MTDSLSLSRNSHALRPRPLAKPVPNGVLDILHFHKDSLSRSRSREPKSLKHAALMRI
jgi:hypothetical protein